MNPDFLCAPNTSHQLMLYFLVSVTQQNQFSNLHMSYSWRKEGDTGQSRSRKLA